MAGEWAFIPPDLHCLDDRLMFRTMKLRGLSRAHSWRATLCYRGPSRHEYELFGEQPPPGAKEEVLPWFSPRINRDRFGDLSIFGL